MSKPNVLNPTIIVTRVDRNEVTGTVFPYYAIQYYDVDLETWCIGYVSYKLAYVQGWLKTELNVVESHAKFVPVRFGEWECIGHDGITNHYRCTACGYEEHDNFTKHHKFCPECGATMRGQE